MAMLDPRLLDLIETLTSARLDWLAFEVLDAVNAGLAVEESAEAIAAARDAIRDNVQPKARGEPQTSAAAARSLVGDEQIAWAADYVGKRLADTLGDLEASIDNLDLIMASTGEDATAVGPPLSTEADTSLTVVLADLEETRKSSRDDVAVARNTVPTLRTALNDWAIRARGQVAT